MRVTLLLLLAVATLFTLQNTQADWQASLTPWFGDKHSSAPPERFTEPLDLMRQARLEHWYDLDELKGLELQATKDPRSPMALAQAQPSQHISPVVQVAAFKGNQFLRAGSGFILHLDGRILTNSHVIHNVSSASDYACQEIPRDDTADRVVILVTEKGEDNSAVPRYVASIKKDAYKIDLALLQISARIENNFNDLNELVQALSEPQTTLQTASLKPEEVVEELKQKLPRGPLVPWTARTLKREQSITLRGFPATRANLKPILSSRLATVSEINEPQGLIFATPSSEVGMSGGPVIDRNNGLVIGIICAIRGVQTLARSINTAAIANLLKGINQAPVARFHWRPENPKPGEETTFDACAFLPQDRCAEQGSFDPDGQIAEYQWAFDVNGDGRSEATLYGQKITFTFDPQQVASDREPRVTLTVTDKEGLTNSLTQTIVLTRPQQCKARIQERPQAGEFTSMQAAIGNARDGETILVEEGICQENVRITKPLTLRGAGAGRTTLLGDGRDAVITIDKTQGVTVQAFTIRGGREAIRVLDSTMVVLEDNALERNLEKGLDATSSQISVQRNRIADNEGTGIRLTDSSASFKANTMAGNRDNGLLLRSKSKATLANNVLENNIGVGVLVTGGSELSTLKVEVNGTKRDPSGDGGHGIVLQDGSTAMIAGSRIEGNKQDGLVVINATAKIQEGQGKRTVISANYNNGVQALGSSTATLADTVIEKNLSSGVAVFDFAKVSITSSLIKENGFRGVHARGSKDARLVIEASTITRNHLDEIVVADSATAVIKKSLISNNETASGVFIADFASAEIEGNEIKNNARCGIAASEKATVRGSNNEVSGNKPDLCCPVPAMLRKTPPATKAKVNVPEDVSSVQEAVDIILPGGMIVIAPGVYQEAVTITKDLTLQGAGADQTTIGNTISILSEARRVTIQGVTVTGGIEDGIGLCGLTEAHITAVKIVDNRETGVNVPGTARAIIDNTRIERNRRGVVVANEGQAIISNSTISENKRRGADGSFFADQQVDFGPGFPAGVIAFDSGQVRVIRSKITNNTYGMLIAASAQAWILEGSEIKGSDYHGIHVSDRGKLEISDAIISQNGSSGIGFGVKLERSAGAIVANSRIIENRGGILISKSDPVITITGNEISRNIGTGVDVRESSRVKIEKNTIKGNQGCGVFADATSAVSGCGNELFGNQKGDLCGNVPDLRRGCD